MLVDTAPNVSPAEAGKRIAKIRADAMAAAEGADKKANSDEQDDAAPEKKKKKKVAAPEKTAKKPAPAEADADQDEDPDKSDDGQSEAAGDDDVDEGDPADEAEDQLDEGQDHDGEAEEQDDEDDEDGTLYTVLADGKELQVPLKELLQGYSRTVDYTRKTEALAKQRKEVDAIQEKVKDLPQVREKYVKDGERFSKNAALVFAALQTRFMPQAPDAALLKTDPAGYIAAKEQHAEALQFMGGLQQELMNIEAGHKANHQKALAEGKTKLLTLRPELADAGNKQKLIAYALNLGFTQDALENEPNPVLFDIAYKAMLYDELQSRKGKIKAETRRPKIMKQTKAQESQTALEQKTRTETLALHQQQGTVNSGAAAISNLLKKKK